VRVENAGIVLASSFIPALFEKLGLIRNNQFLDQESNKRAVMLLSYLGTGVSNFDNRFQSYLLNKILSGLDVDVDEDEEFGTSLEPSEEEKNLINGLIGAMISQWPIIGDSGVTAFRRNWFVRSGILYETDNSWELVIERRPYDILLSNNPYSNSIVNYPWMKKPLYIRWNY
jgi:hypothetical protein